MAEITIAFAIHSVDRSTQPTKTDATPETIPTDESNS